MNISIDLRRILAVTGAIAASAVLLTPYEFVTFASVLVTATGDTAAALAGIPA